MKPDTFTRTVPFAELGISCRSVADQGLNCLSGFGKLWRSPNRGQSDPPRSDNPYEVLLPDAPLFAHNRALSQAHKQISPELLTVISRLRSSAEQKRLPGGKTKALQSWQRVEQTRSLQMLM